MTTAPSAAEESLRDAVLLYASFDRAVGADRGGGGLTFATRFGPPGVPDKYVFKPGFDERVFRIAPGQGVHGGALEVIDVLPENGRIFLPVRGNLDYQPGGWSGAISFWINTDPNTQLKTTFCDPVQITQKGAGDGGIWCDFNNAKPRRDLRMGVFPAVAQGQKPIAEDAPDAPLVRIPGPVFKVGAWRHIVMSWRNLDTGKADAEAVLYLDGAAQGAIDKRPLAMQWEVDKAGIYVAVNYIGLLDELATFCRALTPDEVRLLHRQPGLLAKQE